ncbi:MAG TPA: hypothetical protein VFV34_16055 [Blastocatellia bacterium]|nr:hypothetical protein [Blastocatellia bacterium]
MNPERWKQLEHLFDAALEQPPEARQMYLAEAFAGDPELLEQARNLLASDERAGNFIETPVLARHNAQTEEMAPPTPVIGRRLGSYRIVREIGRGGMGSVYLAVRADDEFQKRVAIKLIKESARSR